MNYINKRCRGETEGLSHAVAVSLVKSRGVLILSCLLYR